MLVSVTALKNDDREAAVMRFRHVIAACTKAIPGH